MKQRIRLGAYGWRQKHWLGVFYPDDLPVEEADDWRLSYYSNEFNCVLVPADYWQAGQGNDCEDWLQSVNEDFCFFVECRASMLERITLTELTAVLKKLSPQLSGLVMLEESQQVPDDMVGSFFALAESLQLDLFTSGQNSKQQGIWQPEKHLSNKATVSPESTCFAYIEDDLSELRKVRVMVERFAAQLRAAQLQAEEAVIIVHHPHLTAASLSKVKSLLEIMGY